jgi:hypothetical protein
MNSEVTDIAMMQVMDEKGRTQRRAGFSWVRPFLLL